MYHEKCTCSYPYSFHCFATKKNLFGLNPLDNAVGTLCSTQCLLFLCQGESITSCFTKIFLRKGITIESVQEGFELSRDEKSISSHMHFSLKVASFQELNSNFQVINYTPEILYYQKKVFGRETNIFMFIKNWEASNKVVNPVWGE